MLNSILSPVYCHLKVHLAYGPTSRDMNAYSIVNGTNVIFHSLTDDGTFGYSTRLTWLQNEVRCIAFSELFTYKGKLYVLMISYSDHVIMIFDQGANGMARRLLSYSSGHNDTTVHDFGAPLSAGICRGHILIQPAGDNRIYVAFTTYILCIDLTLMTVIDRIEYSASCHPFIITDDGLTMICSKRHRQHDGPVRVTYIYMPKGTYADIATVSAATREIIIYTGGKYYRIADTCDPVKLEEASENEYMRASLHRVTDGIQASLSAAAGFIQLYRTVDWSMYEIALPDIDGVTARRWIQNVGE